MVHKVLVLNAHNFRVVLFLIDLVSLDFTETKLILIDFSRGVFSFATSLFERLRQGLSQSIFLRDTSKPTERPR